MAPAFHPHVRIRTALTATVLALYVSACGGSSTAPTPTPAARFKLTGLVTSSAGGPVTGATVLVLDGPNANQSTTTDSAGRYTFASLQGSGFSMRATLDGFTGLTKPVTLTADGTLDFTLEKILRAVLTSDNVVLDGVLEPDGTYSFPSSASNTGDGCAGHIIGVSDFATEAGALVASVSWTLPQETIVRPGEHFQFRLCCLTRDQAFTATRYTTRFSFGTVPCQ